jgi:hypothetical protein
MLALVPKNVAGNNQRCIGRIVAEAEAGNDVGPDETRLMSASDAFESPGIDILGLDEEVIMTSITCTSIWIPRTRMLNRELRPSLRNTNERTFGLVMMG